CFRADFVCIASVRKRIKAGGLCYRTERKFGPPCFRVRRNVHDQECDAHCEYLIVFLPFSYYYRSVHPCCSHKLRAPRRLYLYRAPKARSSEVLQKEQPPPRSCRLISRTPSSGDCATIWACCWRETMSRRLKASDGSSCRNCCPMSPFVL